MAGADGSLAGRTAEYATFTRCYAGVMLAWCFGGGRVTTSAPSGPTECEGRNERRDHAKLTVISSLVGGHPGPLLRD